MQARAFKGVWSHDMNRQMPVPSVCTLNNNASQLGGEMCYAASQLIASMALGLGAYENSSPCLKRKSNDQHCRAFCRGLIVVVFFHPVKCTKADADSTLYLKRAGGRIQSYYLLLKILTAIAISQLLGANFSVRIPF